MGWLFCSPDRASLIKTLKFRITRPDAFERGTVAPNEISVVGNTLYALLRLQEPQPCTTVILVYLLKGAPEYPGDPNAWGYKDMDETCGPNITTCPKKFLSQSDCNDSYAPEWRQLCLNWHAEQSLIRSLTPGLYRMTFDPPHQTQWLDLYFPDRIMRFDGKNWRTPDGRKVRGARRSWGWKYQPEKCN